jgi:hypothetical protein
MSAGYPTRLEIPPDTRPVALLISGLRRGAVLVFLPVFAAGQAIAWLTYAVSGWYRPWSWFKIGIAETLASVRVTFIGTSYNFSAKTPGPIPATSASLELAVGALLIAVCVLAFRAGREQARGLESRPLAAGVAGSLPGLGFAIPMVVAAAPVTLGFPQFGIEHLEPVLRQALVLPLAVAGACGAVGGLAAARAGLDEREPWGPRLAAAARGGFTALWWALALAFAGFLIVAALQPGPTGAYARFVDRTGGSGAALAVQHALVLPNQSAMILDTAMGVPTTLAVGDTTLVRVTITGIEAIGTEGAAVAGLVGAGSDHAGFPAWYWAFVLVPVAATVIGGRAARSPGSPTRCSARSRRGSPRSSFPCSRRRSAARSVWGPTRSGPARPRWSGACSAARSARSRRGQAAARTDLGRYAPTSLKLLSICVYRRQACPHPSSVRGNRSTGVAGFWRSQMPKNVRP